MELSIDRVKEKIHKLFAMTIEAGASQQEVETAIKKAQRLMVQYKLSEQDIAKDSNMVPTVVTKYCMDIEYTAQVDYWVLTLTHTIADNFRCAQVSWRKTTRTRVAGFMGEPDDVEIASQVLCAAYGLVKAAKKNIVSNARRFGYTSAQTTSMCNAYGVGFAKGIAEALKKQMEQESYELVLQVPAHVTEKVNNTCRKVQLGTNNASYKADKYAGYKTKGYQDGKAFTARKAIA